MANRSRGFYWKLALTNLRNNRRVYLPYILSSIGIAMMFYIMCALGPGIDQENMYGGASVSSMMFLGSIVIGIFSVLFLFYTNSFIMKRRKKELGLYNILGMEKRHIAKVILRETLMVAVLCIVLGLGLGILFSKLMFLVLGKVLGLELPIAFIVPSSAVISTVALFFCIFFATMLYNILQVRLAKPIELLHGGETGEKEPKAHWLLAVLGALLLGSGYYIAVTITSPLDALMFFFIAVILVILGTYLLFMTGITAMLKILKKNKKFYYKATHFTTVSGMLYRMKQNAAGLASICILFTALLVTVSTTFSLYTSMDDLIHTRYPRNILILSRGANDAAKEAIQTIAEEECEKVGKEPLQLLERSYWNCSMNRIGNDFTPLEGAYMYDSSGSYSTFTLFTLEEFNRFSGQNETLGDNELLLSDPRGTFPADNSITISGREFSIRRTDYNMDDGEGSAMIYDIYYVVVPNMETVEFILEPTGNVLDPLYSYDFDIDGEQEDIAALGSAIRYRFSEAFPMEGVEFDSLQAEDSASSYEDFFSLYGGLFFLGLFLGFLFLLGTALIIYYKQVSEGYEDARRFSIMQKVGMSHKEVKKSIHSQILLVFFLPLLTAVLHLAFAFPMLQKILAVLNLVNVQLILLSTLGCVIVFAIAYAIIYAITAKTYYKIVESAAD